MAKWRSETSINHTPVSPNVPSDVIANRAQWREKLSAAAFEGDAATTRLEQVCQRLKIEIIQKLARGELIAKGFQMPRDGLGETEIPRSEWRSLELDPATATAYRYGIVIFTGVLIGKPVD